MAKASKRTEETDNGGGSSDRRVTYYVALPFMRDAQGDLAAGEAAEFQSSRAATAAAHVLKHGGAVAFARTGDPTIGEFDDAVVLVTVGEVPTDLAGFTG